MSLPFNPAAERYGSAAFASESALERAGYFTYRDDSVFIGFYQGRRGLRPLWYHLPAGLLLLGGARSGKNTTILAYNICPGILRTQSILCLDPKAEMAFYSRNQCLDRKYCLYINPSKLFGLPSHRINPLDHLRRDSQTLHADMKVLLENLLPPSGAAQSKYFEDRAREWIEGVALCLVQLDGVLTFPRLYWALNLIPVGGEAWLELAFELSEATISPLCARVEAEIAEGRDEQTGGYGGIIGQMLACVAPLSDPGLMDCVSPHPGRGIEDGFDASMADLCRSDRCYQIYLTPELEHISAYAPILKAFFVSAMTYRARHTSAPRQTWILDEAAALGKFPLLVQGYSAGAGRGVRVLAVYQSRSQMARTAQGADVEIPASAGASLMMALRSQEDSAAASKLCGMQTLRYVDETARTRARDKKSKAVLGLMGGGNVLASAQEIATQKALFAQAGAIKQQRPLLSPEEIRTLGDDRHLLFLDGLPGPVLAHRIPYWRQAAMAGRYLDTPYHPPLGQVEIATGKRRRGARKARVITEAVPRRYRDYPQYRESGLWSYVAGYRP